MSPPDQISVADIPLTSIRFQDAGPDRCSQPEKYSVLRGNIGYTHDAPPAASSACVHNGPRRWKSTPSSGRDSSSVWSSGYPMGSYVPSALLRPSLSCRSTREIRYHCLAFHKIRRRTVARPLPTADCSPVERTSLPADVWAGALCSFQYPLVMRGWRFRSSSLAVFVPALSPHLLRLPFYHMSAFDNSVSFSSALGGFLLIAMKILVISSRLSSPKLAQSLLWGNDTESSCSTILMSRSSHLCHVHNIV